MRRVFTRLLKWLLWFTCGFMLLITLFLAIPGIDGSWRFPSAGKPWIVLGRATFQGGHLDVRQVTLGGFEVRLFIVGAPAPVPKGSRTLHWDDGAFTWIGDHWIFSAGAKARSLIPMEFF